MDFIYFRYQEDVHRRELQAHRPLKVLLLDRNLEVVPVLPPINVEAPLVHLVRDTVANLGPEHHLVAAHKVLHNVIEDGLQSVFIDHIEVNLLISYYLDTDVPTNIVNETAQLDRVIEDPLPLLSVFVLHDFEEEDVSRAPSDQSIVVNKVHLPQIHVGHFIEDEVARIVGVYDERLALPVEHINLIPLIVVEALVSEVLPRTIKLRFHK
mmetsp:Transcript_2923/g.4510  ORF Transcript_2923/g.4510 Transcript_2923/m.4510 type:complete len:210 (+) Transcript_2923:3004-3633(+)